MLRKDEVLLPQGVTEDRRVRTDRRRLSFVELSRVLGAAVSTRPGHIALRATKGDGGPIVITLPVEAAMTLLNDLQYLAATDGWFEIEPPPDQT